MVTFRKSLKWAERKKVAKRRWKRRSKASDAESKNGKKRQKKKAWGVKKLNSTLRGRKAW